MVTFMMVTLTLMALVHIAKVIGVSLKLDYHLTLSKYLNIQKHDNFADSDCGRGFKRIGSTCVNISEIAVPSTEVEAKCAELGALPLTTTSSEMFYQLRVCLNLKKYISKVCIFTNFLLLS